jgi:hypothetical protein
MTFDTRDGCRLYHDGVLIARWVNGKRIRKVNQLFFHLTNPAVHSSWATVERQSQDEPEYIIDDIFVEIRQYAYASVFQGGGSGDESGFDPWTSSGAFEYHEETQHEHIIFGENISAENPSGLTGQTELDLTQFSNFDPNNPMMEIRFNIAETWSAGSGDISVDLTLGNATQSVTETAVASAAVYGSAPNQSGYHSTDQFGNVQFGGVANTHIGMTSDPAWINDSFLTFTFDQQAKNPRVKIYYDEEDLTDSLRDPNFFEPVQVAFLETTDQLTFPTFFRATDVGSVHTNWRLGAFTLSDNTPTLADRFTDGDYTANPQWTVDSGPFSVVDEQLEFIDPNAAIHLDFGGTYGVENYSSVEIVFTLRQNISLGSSTSLKFGLFDTKSGQGYVENAVLSGGFYPAIGDPDDPDDPNDPYFAASGFNSYDANGDLLPGTAGESIISTFAHNEVFSIRFEAFGPTSGITVRKNKRLMAQWPNFLGLTSVDRFTIQKDGNDELITWIVDDVKVYAELVADAPEFCGDSGTVYFPGDISGPFSGVSDCNVNEDDLEFMSASWLDPYDLTTFSDIASDWMDCNDPGGCI